MAGAVTRARAHQLEQLAGAVAALVRRVEAGEARERELRERVGSLSGALNRAWSRIEVLERARFAPAVRAPAPALERRVPATEAAELIGCNPRTVRRMVESGRLRGAALDLGAGRKHWTVEAADLERLLTGSPAAPVPEKRPDSGRRAV